MELKLKYNIYPTIEIEEIINCCQNPTDYIIEKARNLISEDCFDSEYYLIHIKKKFEQLNQLLGIFPDKEVVEAILRFELEELTSIYKYQEFKKVYSDEEMFRVEVNAEIDLHLFKFKYDKHKAIENE